MPDNEEKPQSIDPASMLVQARAACELMKSLSNEKRLLILCNLTTGEKTVTQLEDLLGFAQATLSQQLARLRAERLVDTRRDGRLVYYSISDARVSALVGSLYDLYCKV